MFIIIIEYDISSLPTKFSINKSANNKIIDIIFILISIFNFKNLFKRYILSTVIYIHDINVAMDAPFLSFHI